jgi:hypothetical protein
MVRTLANVSRLVPEFRVGKLLLRTNRLPRREELIN